MTGRRVVAVVAWLVWIATCAIVVAHARFTADLSAFLPTHPTPEQRAADRPAARRTGVAPDPGRDRRARGAVDDASLAALSRQTATTLRRDDRFLSVNNGEVANGSADRTFLFDHRYLLSDRVTAERFTVPRPACGARGQPRPAVVVGRPDAATADRARSDRRARPPRRVAGAGRDLPTVDGAWVVRPCERATACAAGRRDARGRVRTSTGSSRRSTRCGPRSMPRSARAARRSQAARSCCPGRRCSRSTRATRSSARRAGCRSSGSCSCRCCSASSIAPPRALVLGLLPMITGALSGLAAVATRLRRRPRHRARLRRHADRRGGRLRDLPVRAASGRRSRRSRRLLGARSRSASATSAIGFARAAVLGLPGARADRAAVDRRPRRRGRGHALGAAGDAAASASQVRPMPALGSLLATRVPLARRRCAGRSIVARRHRRRRAGGPSRRVSGVASSAR